MPPAEFLHHLMRLQFGLSASFHFLFVPLSLGLLLCMNVLQTLHVVTGREAPHHAARFWGRLFLLTWITGLITGYPLRWQLTEIWDHYLHTAAPVFKEIFAIEGWIAPLMMGCVLLVMAGRAWLPAWATMVLGWLLLMLMWLQSLTILSINAWMQNPRSVPYESGAWQLSSAWPLLLSGTTLHKGFHTLSAALLSGAFCLLAISSHYIIQRKHLAASQSSFKVAAWVGMGAVVCVLWSGHMSAAGVGKVQPMKFAAFEGHWKAESHPASLVLWAWPDEAHDLNRQELAIPYLMSFLQTDDMSSPPGIVDLTSQTERTLRQLWPSHQEAVMQALQQPPMRGRVPGLDESLQLPEHDEQRAWLKLRESVAMRMGPIWDSMSQQAQITQVARAARPPVTAVFIAFRLMVGSGMLCLLVCLGVFVKRESLARGQHLNWLKMLPWIAPLPWLAIISGWGVAEMGRQPWTIYEHLPTFQANSLPNLEQGLLGFLMMLLAGVSLGLAFMRLAKSIVQAGPDAEHFIDWHAPQRWIQRISRRPVHQGGNRPALVRLDGQDMNMGHPPQPFEKAA